MRALFVAWSPFALATIVSIGAYQWGYAIPGYPAWLVVLAVLSLLCGMWAVGQSARKSWAVAAVLVGLTIGQGRLLFWAIVIVGWKINGFAP